MSLKRRFEQLLRGRIRSSFSKVADFETAKFMDETATLIAEQAEARNFDGAARHNLLYQIQRKMYPAFVIADEGRVILEDQAFRAIFTAYSDDNWTSFERKWNLKELLKQVRHLPGEFAECGVFRGGSAHLMCIEAAAGGRRVHLFDSFQGLSVPNSDEDSHWTRGDLAVTEAVVRENLQGFDNFDVYTGWIPERFDEVEHLNFSFVHIDVDLEQPTRDSIEFFYPRLVPGGILLLDDHGSKMCPGARRTTLDYFSTAPEEVLDLATGQGLVIKR